MQTQGFRFSTRRLSWLAAATLTAASLIAQQPARTKRDTAFVIRIMRPGVEDQLLVRLDSLRRVLDLEPLGSADRAQLKFEAEKLVSALNELARTSRESGARVGALSGLNIKGAFAQAFGGQGEGLSQFRAFAPRGWIGITAEAPRMHTITADSEFIRY